VIDGTTTPEKFIRFFEYDQEFIETIELFSDGYCNIPAKVSIEAWEESYRESEREDPDKWLKFKSTKSRDDRTIAIISLPTTK
jgi:hypothetical protein